VAVAQFGVGARKKGSKTPFEIAQEKAAAGNGRGARGGGGNGLASRRNAAPPVGATGDAEMDALLSELTAGMSAEELQQLDEMLKSVGDLDMGDMESSMAEVFKAMAEMNPDEMVATIQEAVKSPEFQEVLSDPVKMLENVRGMGVVDDALIDEYIANPRKYKREIKTVTDEIMAVLNDPEMLKGMISMMTGMAEMMADPEAMEKALLEIVEEFENWNTDMGDDDKLEAARLEMLSNPDLTSNPMLKSVFDTKEMQEILNDPKKWKATIEEGQQTMRKGMGSREL
jgi:hypothetical protein